MRVGIGGDNRFGAFALITAGESVDFEGGPSRALFGRSEAPLAKEFWHAEKLLIGAVAAGKPRELFSLKRRKRDHVVIKSRHGDAAVFIAQFREQLAQRHRGVFDGAAENAGVQIAG